MAKSKKSTPSIKEIKKLEEEIKYDVEIVENLQKKSILSQDDLDLIKLFNQKIQEKTEKLQALKGITDDLKESSDDYESVLRSIGHKYGEINSIYKESEKILALNKEEISGILSITGLLNSSNTRLIDGILESQKAYKGITTSIVENIGGLEDSETSYKKINFEIAKQEELIGSIKEELKNIDKSDELQVKAAEELKIQLDEQTVSLGKMKKAGENVKRTFDGINMLGNELSNTMFGGWVDKFLSITKVAGVTSFGSISEMLDKFKEPSAEKTINKLTNVGTVSQQPQTQVPPPTQTQVPPPTQTQVPPPTQPEAVQKNVPTELPSTIQVSTEKLEEEQLKYAEKSAESMSSFSAASLRDERRKNRASRVSFGKYASKEKSTKIESPSIEKVANEIKDNNSIQIQNSEKTNEVISNSQTNTSDALEQIKTQFKQTEIERANASEKEKIESRQTDISGKLQSDKAALASRFLGGGSLIAKAGIAAAVIGLGKEIASFGDSMNAVIARYITTVTGGTETMKRFSESIVSGKGVDFEKFKKSIEDTEDYRKLQFQYTIKANVKERQNLETDYFNYQKQVFFDYYDYENEVVRQNVDYELGLRRDALQFELQQQSANLDAELEKRKTLAGSGMKFINAYAKISERALNAIGSSTKSIIDGMRQFQYVFGIAPKQLFSLVENAQGLAQNFGASTDQVLNMSHMFKLLGKTTEEVGMGLVEGLISFGGKEYQALFAEIAESSADIYRLMSATPEQIAKQTAALGRAGIKLSNMLKASDTMVLNYKDSIKAEMSLGAMIGRSVNFTEARARLMSGDMVGAARAIQSQLAGIDLQNMNPFARQELTRATGLQMDQLMQIQATGTIKTEDDKRLEQAKQTGKAFANAVLNQDIANAAAKLALEQSQRKQMLEMEQAQRLVMLRLEQKQKLEQIPVESAYRFYWDKIYAFKFAKEDMRIDTLGEVLTSLFQKGNDVTGGAEQYLKQLEKQQLGPDANVMQNLQTLGINYQTTAAGQISIPSLQTNVGATANLTPQLNSLGNTIVTLDNKVNDMNISSKDIRYQQWLLGSHDISQKYKGGKTPELAEKEYNDLFNKLFYAEVQLESINKTVQSTFGNAIDLKVLQDTDMDKYREIVTQFTDKGVMRGKYATVDGKEYTLGDLKLRNILQQKLDQQRQLQMNQVDILKQQLQQGKITQATFNSKIEELKKSVNLNVTLPVTDTNGNPKQVGTPSFLPPFANPNYNPNDPFNFTKIYAGMIGAQPNDGTYVRPNYGSTPNVYTPPQTASVVTDKPKPNAYTPPQTASVVTDKPKPNVVSNEDAKELARILGLIQSQADTRGINIAAKLDSLIEIENRGNGYLDKILTRDNNTMIFIESANKKLDYQNRALPPIYSNIEDIQIEMIKVLQDNTALLSLIANKEAATTITLDGKVISDNITNRMANKKAFNKSSQLKYIP